MASWVRSTILVLALAGVTSAGGVVAQAADDGEAAFRDLYRELVEINTTRSAGSCTQAAEAMRARLLAAGIAETDATILAPADRPTGRRTVPSSRCCVVAIRR